MRLVIRYTSPFVATSYIAAGPSWTRDLPKARQFATVGELLEFARRISSEAELSWFRASGTYEIVDLQVETREVLTEVVKV